MPWKNQNNGISCFTPVPICVPPWANEFYSWVFPRNKQNQTVRKVWTQTPSYWNSVLLFWVDVCDEWYRNGVVYCFTIHGAEKAGEGGGFTHGKLGRPFSHPRTLCFVPETNPNHTIWAKSSYRERVNQRDI